MDVLAPTARVFAALVARLEAAPAFPKMERKYVSVGEIDFPTPCAQFAVAARQVYAGEPGQPINAPIIPHDGMVPLSLEIGVAYTRCWPTPASVLKAEKEDAFGREVMAECSILLTEVEAAYRALELVDECVNASIGPAVFVGPEGGIAGVTVMITVRLN